MKGTTGLPASKLHTVVKLNSKNYLTVDTLIFIMYLQGFVACFTLFTWLDLTVGSYGIYFQFKTPAQSILWVC